MAKGISPLIVVVLLATVALLPTFAPNVVWHLMIAADFFIPGWTIFGSPWAKAYHAYLIDRLPDREELPLRELALKDATWQTVKDASDGWTIPIVIRGALANAPALKTFQNRTWWRENYGDEEVMCKYVEALGAADAPACRVSDAMGAEDGTGRMYISGESKIFNRRPELLEMLQSDFVDEIAPGKKVFTQMFFGYPGTGSDVHSAIGCNMFRMIAGRKKWWLMPPSQTPYVLSSLNANGFSAHTLTMIGKGNQQQATWMKKLERYTATLEPGDILLNTPWYWHGIQNLMKEDKSDANDLVVGIPTRYASPGSSAALRSNWFLSVIALATLQKEYSGVDSFTSDSKNLQEGIEKARNSRAAEFAVDGVPDVLDATVD